MSRIREMAVLAACARVIRTWSVEARAAFREAVYQDVAEFAPGEWDATAVKIRAHVFGERWRRGLPWPPRPDELVADAVAEPVIDRAAIVALARRMRALGVELACATR